MSELVNRLRATPNWMRETFAPYKSGVKKYDRAPFEAADRIEALEARVEELEAERDAVPTLSPQSLAWARAEAEKIEARDAAMRALADAIPALKYAWSHGDLLPKDGDDDGPAAKAVRQVLNAHDALTKAEG